METRGYNVKEVFHFVDWDHPLPEEPLPKWKAVYLGAVALILSHAEWKSCSG